MGLLLIAAGAVFALFFILNALIQTFRRQPQLGFWQTALAFLTALLPLAGLTSYALNGTTQPERNLPIPYRFTLLIAGALIVLSLLVTLLELRREEKLKGSRGIFGMGVGLLLTVAVFAVPVLSQNVLQPALATPTPIVAAAVVQQQSATQAQTSATESTIQLSPTATRTASPTLTSTPTRNAPTATASPTRFRFMTQTPQPTATLPNPCLALTNYNVNVRTEPDLESDVLVQIPYNTTVTLFGRDEDSEWWFSQYENQTGWLKGEFINVSASCNDLPVRR